MPASGELRRGRLTWGRAAVVGGWKAPVIPVNWDISSFQRLPGSPGCWWGPCRWLVLWQQGDGGGTAMGGRCLTHQ